MNHQKRSVRQTEVDAYTQHIMTNIPPEVFSTLNIVQIQAIESAISNNAPFRKHPLDLRGQLSLYFIRYYFVILIGRDRRSSSINKEERRRTKAKSVSVMMFIYALICMLAPILFIALYLIKSFLGIDIFPDQHLSDFFSSN